jgi:AmmeMemoRadiSam system protein A
MSLPPHSSPPQAINNDQPSSCVSSGASASAGQEYSSEERSQLLRLAHDSIAAALQNQDLSRDAPSGHFAEARGAFTTLYLRGELRGCVGYVLPRYSLYRAVAETARAAAFEDHRFAPVTQEEAPLLKIELSILSPPQRISAEQIEVGRHGLLITGHGRRGLLLPQVPVEHGWDRVMFLQQTCRKAGLPFDAWQSGATIEAFTAEIFGEKTPE